MTPRFQITVVLISCLTLLCISLVPSCATFKHVVRTIDDVASDACQLFALQNPDEFAQLVEQVAPAKAQEVRYGGFNVREICAVHEVLKPFIDSQLELQQRTAAGIRANAGNPNATPSE